MPFSQLDRCVEIRIRPEALAAERADERGLYLPLWRSRQLVAPSDPPEPVFLSRAEAEALPAELVAFLGRLDERPCFALGLPNDRDFSGVIRGDFNDLRLLGPTLDPAVARLFAYARALVGWHRAARCCGKCGTVMRAEEGGHVRVCPICEVRHFPRTDPAMMALIRRGDRILLARQPGFPPRMVSILAGFVEPGESLEEAVVREVREEVGLSVRDLRYLRSQPWPFPGSLMIGFSMWSDEGEIVVDEHELEAADWYSREQILAAQEIFVPPTFSLAGQLIGMFLSGELDG